MNKVNMISSITSFYPGWGPGPGRVGAVCCGGRKPWQSQPAGLSSRAHSDPLDLPARGCPSLLSGTLVERRRVLRRSEPDRFHLKNKETIGLLVRLLHKSCECMWWNLSLALGKERRQTGRKQIKRTREHLAVNTTEVGEQVEQG